jgi:hypothetical protein
MIYYVFLLAALAVAAAGVGVRRRSERLGQWMVVLGVLGCAGCLAWRVRQTIFPPDAAGPDRGQAVLGYFLAQHVLAEVGNQQGTIVLMFPPESVFDADTVGTCAGTFSRVLRSFPELKVEVLTLEASRKAAKTGQFGLAVFQQAVAKTPPALAYVSFAGVPADIEKFATPGSQARPGFFVFDPWGTTNWFGALRSGRVRTVIVPRPGINRRASAEVSGEPHEVFNQLYLMGTPSTAAQLAEKLGGK